MLTCLQTVKSFHLSAALVANDIGKARGHLAIRKSSKNCHFQGRKMNVNGGYYMDIDINGDNGY